MSPACTPVPRFGFFLRPSAVPLSGICPRSVRDNERSLAQLEGEVNRLAQPSADRWAVHQAIDHHFNIVPHLPIEREIVGQLHDLAIDPRADETLFQQILEQIAKLTFLATYHRGEHHEGYLGGQRLNPGDNLLARLRRDRPRTLGAMSLSDAGIQHPQKIVDLGDRPDGGSRIVTRRFLGNRDRRAQATDVVHFGLGHLAEELPGKRRETFDIAPLPLGIECVERERAFPAPTHAREANQLISRQRKIDAAEVVFAGTFDDDI